MNLPSSLTDLGTLLTRGGDPAWFVGGAIRDLLQGRPIVDVDLAVRGDASIAARAVADAHSATLFPLSETFGSWRIVGGTLPFSVDITPIQGDDLAEDLARRDLTVNAMALPASGGDLIDPHGGRDDLERGVLRMVRPSAFSADPVRMVRLARIALQTGFVIDPDTHLRARMDAPGVATVAGERVLAEMRLMARHEEAWRGFETLDDLGALGVIVPDLEEARGLEQTAYHHLDVLGHTMEVVRYACEIRRAPEEIFRGDAPFIRNALAEPLADGLTRGDALAFAALFHDVAKPRTFGTLPDGRITFMGHDRIGADMVDEWSVKFGASTRFREVVAQCVREHLRLGFMVHRQPLSLRQIVRYWWATSPADAELLVLTSADRLATNGPRTTPPQISRHLDVVRQMTRTIRELASRGEPRPLVDGSRIIALANRPAGAWVGRAVARLREEQMIGRITTREQAERLIREIAAADSEEGRD